MNYRTLTALSLFLAATALPALAGTPMSTDRETTGLAWQLLQDADSARSALANDDITTAKRDIDEALAARTRMLDMARPNSGSPSIVPIFSELDDTAIVSPAHAGVAASPAPLASASPGALTVRANDARYTYLAIDLTKTKSRLDAAKTALHNDNRQAAEDSLAAIGSDLIATTDSTDVPLLTAREDLALAQRAMHAKALPAAAADLRQAAVALNAYSRPEHRADAQRLANEIQNLEPVTTGTASSASAKIEAWWSSVKTWFSQHV